MNFQLNKTDSINQKIIISSLLFLCILFFAYFIVLAPIARNIVDKKIAISNLKIEIIKNQEKERNMDILIGKLKTIEPQIEKLDSAIISDNSGLEFIVAMEEIAKKNNIKQVLDMKAPMTDESDPAHMITPLDINARGDFNDIYNYIDDLESMAYYFNIDELSLESETLPGENKNQANLHLLAFSYWKNNTYENK